jgi:CRP-like cAMP-binding protein
MPSDVNDHLTFFADLTPEQRALVHPIFLPCDCYADMVLFEQGDPAENLFLILSGEVMIRYKPDDGPAISVARVKAGGVVGWSAALGNRTYTSGAVCTGYAQMLRLRGEDLRDLYIEHPETGILVLERLASVIAERLDSTYEQVVELLKQGMCNGMPSFKEV